MYMKIDNRISTSTWYVLTVTFDYYCTGGVIQHSDSIYCCIMIYLFLDLKTWARCGQDLPYPKEIFLAHKKCGTLCVLLLCIPEQTRNFLHQFRLFFISSPGPKVQVNYCHHLASVVCCLSSVNFSHFKLLLRNHWADWNQT